MKGYRYLERAGARQLRPEQASPTPPASHLAPGLLRDRLCSCYDDDDNSHASRLHTGPALHCPATMLASPFLPTLQLLPRSRQQHGQHRCRRASPPPPLSSCRHAPVNALPPLLRQGPAAACRRLPLLLRGRAASAATAAATAGSFRRRATTATTATAVREPPRPPSQPLSS